MLKLAKNQSLSWFRQSLSSWFCVLSIINHPKFKIETISSILNGFQRSVRLPECHSYAYFASNHKNQDFSWYYQSLSSWFGILPILNDFTFLAMFTEGHRKIEILTNRQAYLDFLPISSNCTLMIDTIGKFWVAFKSVSVCQRVTFYARFGEY